MESSSTLTGVDRCTLRRDVLRDLGDLVLLVATRDGDENSFIDEVNLNAEVGGYTGREAYFCSSSGIPSVNDNQARYVIDSSRSQHAIAFAAALPGPTMTGDECELINLRGVGFHAHQVNEALNESIRFAQRHTQFALSVASVAMDPVTGTFAIPADFRTLEHVAYHDLEGRLQKLTRVDSRQEPGYLVDKLNRTIELGWGIGGAYLPDNYFTSSPTELRIDGLVEPAELHADTDRTKIDHEWLVFQTQAHLARAKFLRSPSPESQAVMGVLMNQANALREQLAVRRSPWSVDLGSAAVAVT